MNRFLFQLIAPNDGNGNPRVLTVVQSPAPNGHKLAEVYRGDHTNSGKALFPDFAVKIPAGEYNRILKLLPELPESIAETL